MVSDRYVIIGAGQAACQTAVSLRAAGFSGRITLIGDEIKPPYQRPPLSKKYLSGEIGEDRLYLRPPTFFAQNKIELMLGIRATMIDRAQKTVSLSSGETLSYQKLLLATGSAPRRLEVRGATLGGVHYMRSMTDVKAFRKELRPGARLIVIGGGYVGLEAAAACVKLGLRVQIIEAASRLLARVAGPEVSGFLLDAHRACGIDVRLGETVSELIGKQGKVTAIGLAGGRELAADTVLIGVGAVPNTELAALAGLTVSDGIVVDECAQTADDAIFAAGDCTVHPNRIYGRVLRLESVHNAIEQAKTAASTMIGKSRPYVQVPWFWSDQYQFKLQMSGLVQGADTRRISGEPGKSPFAVHHYRDGRLVAVEAIDAPAKFMTGKAKILADHGGSVLARETNPI
jgi:3-phenylpropionate/trans-cinnamate dioxygenase ferredoxin reductase component